MEINTDKKFRDHYGLLLNNFKQELDNSGIHPENISGNLPYPFIPAFGKNYEKSDFKIAFVGRDAKYDTESGLKEFLSSFDPLKYSDLLNYDSNDPIGYPEFICYTKGKSFWRFVLNFLLLFYNKNKLSNLDNWADLKVDGEILRSFVYGNVDSVPKFENIKEHKGINKETWKKVEHAGEVFDNSSHLINVFKPNVILLFYWGAPEKWLPEEKTEFKKFESIKLWYCFAKGTNTHFYWTNHPSSKGYSPKEANKVLFAIINSIKEESIFPTFPGEELIMKQKLIENQIEKIAKELALELTITTKYLGLSESGFYFSKPKWKKFEIGFQFENNGFQGFFYGICKKETKEDINIELINESLKSALGAADGSNPEYFIWWKWHEKKNWDTETFSQISSGEFSKNIKNQIEEIIEKVKGIEL